MNEFNHTLDDTVEAIGLTEDEFCKFMANILCCIDGTTGGHTQSELVECLFKKFKENKISDNYMKTILLLSVTYSQELLDERISIMNELKSKLIN